MLKTEAQLEAEARAMLAKAPPAIDIWKALTVEPPPPEKCRYDEAGKVFELLVYPNGSVYEIGLSECRDYRKLTLWLSHLASKVWFTRKVMRDFLDVWAEVTGLPVHGYLGPEPDQGDA